MRKAISFVLCSIAMAIVLIVGLFLGIVATPKDVFKDNYMNILDAKYDTLTKTKSPKIIIVTGSSAAFSLDGNRLAEMTGMNVANTAVHAGMGALFETELSKANINEGDIVLLGFEWGWVTDDNFTDFIGSDLVMAGIDDRLELYKYVPASKYADILGYLFTFANVKRAYAGEDVGAYTTAAFSENGNTMEYQRNDSPIITKYVQDPNHEGIINFENPIIPEATVKYLKDYKEYVESRGASIYWIGCPTYEAAVQCDYSELQKAVDQEEALIGIPYISNPIDYVFPSEYMYDTIYHTTTRGMEYRTELLYKDLKRAGVV